MTTAAMAKTPLAPLVRVAVLPSLLAGSACAVVGLMSAGSAGFFGAVLAAFLVVGFFWFGHIVLHVMRSIEPSLLLIIALMTYGLQIVILLAIFATFQGNQELAESVSPTALGLTVMACTAVWMVGLVLASRRERIPLYDLGGDAR